MLSFLSQRHSISPFFFQSREITCSRKKKKREMATSVAGVSSLSTPRLFARAAETPKAIKPAAVSFGYSVGQVGSGRMRMIRPVAAAPDKLSEKVKESIKEAQQACSEDPASGECVAAWDEVEELSAAASHKRDSEKNKDPLEAYCSDNPETDECRTYDN